MTGTAESGEFKTTCPFCLAEMDVHFDVKGRPFWRCWRCEVRAFATRAALHILQADGWIWSGERSQETSQNWRERIAAKLMSPR